MNFNYLSSLVCAFLFMAFSLRAMEHDARDITYTDLPPELKTKLIFDTILSAKDMKEAAQQVHALRAVNTEMLNFIENERNSAAIVHDLHNKFDIPKLQVRYMLNMRQTNKVLLERIDIITKYALLHINSLLYRAVSSVQFHQRFSSGPLTLVVLDRAVQTVHQLRKNDKAFWQTTEKIHKEYDGLLSQRTIDIPISADSEEHLVYIATGIATVLLYVTKNAKNIITDIELHKKLKNYVTVNAQSLRPLLSLFNSYVQEKFYPNRIQSDIARVTMSKINVLKKNNDT